MDLRGHGRNATDEQPSTLERFAADLDWLCYALGLYRPVIVGYGLGACIALEMASRHADLALGIAIRRSIPHDSNAIHFPHAVPFLESIGPSVHQENV